MNGAPKKGFLPAVSLGTILNPLNSSMIAVALVLLAFDFGVSATHSSLVISAFYLTAAVGQPLMGKLGDRFGPKKVFLSGMFLVVISGVVGPFVQSFSGLIAIRILQALGTSTAFPGAIAMIRASAQHGKQVQDGMSSVAMANSIGAAAGPLIGGFAVALGGWQMLFWLNVPLAAISGLAVAVTGPRDRVRKRVSVLNTIKAIDPAGIALFTGTVLSLLGFLLSIPTGPTWWLLATCIFGLAFLLLWELRSKSPFLDVRSLAKNSSLLSVYAQFLVFNAAYYGAFFGVPQWLEIVREMPIAVVGLIMLPLAAIGAAITPIASRLVGKLGTSVVLVLGSSALTAGSAGLLLFNESLPVWGIVLILGALGIPYGLCNLALQTQMNASVPATQAGTAAGLYQTSRYLGAILSTSILAFAFSTSISSAQLHIVAIVMVVLSSLLVLFNSAMVFRQRSYSSD